MKQTLNILYDKSHTRRFVIIKEDERMYSYHLELLTLIDKEKNEYEWNPPCCSMSHSLFISEEDVYNDIKLTEEYAKFF